MRGKKIPLEHRNYLLRFYLAHGYTAAKPQAERYHVKPRTLSEIARRAGHYGKTGREPGVWKNGVNIKAATMAESI